MQYAIETHDLNKIYRGNIHALKNFNLNVKTGSCFGLLGPNGAGKSTLVKTLLSIVYASSGSATLLGQDIKNPATRKQVGYLPEGHRFPNYLTGRAVCRYFGRLAGLSSTRLKSEIDAKLALVDMGQWANTRITKYSKGMMQRLGLAQAMLGDPKLIFLDEPTDGVDPVGRHELREVIRNIQTQGTTVFLNSHLLSEVEAMCDEVAILHKGNLVRQGSVEEITLSVSNQENAVIVRFQTSGIDEKTLQQLPPYLEQTDEGKNVQFKLESSQAITGLIDQLRQQQIEIYAIEPIKLDLEDAFIQLIKDPARDDGANLGIQAQGAVA